MKNWMYRFYGMLVLFLLLGNSTFAGEYHFTTWEKQGFNLMSNDEQGLELIYSLSSFSLEKFQTQKGEYDMIVMPGAILPTNEGEPDLPGFGRFIAIPQGAKAHFEIVDMETEIIEGVNILPSPKLQKDTDNSPPTYEKNEKIYGRNAFFPAQAVRMSSPLKIRGVDANILGITPFQYNPVTKQLKVYYNIKIKVSFEGGNGHFGEDRLRNRWWDPILEDEIFNYSSLPAIDYDKKMHGNSKEAGCEYLIIVPDAPEFTQWADSLKVFRTTQGIDTKVVSLSEIGGNNYNTIENYINDAYNNWDVPPAAVLLMADYGTNASNSITSPIYDSYCISDNIYADVDSDGLPDIVFARMTARNAAELETMVSKVLENERTPSTQAGTYDHPVTACGFQTERWFQIAAETIAGFWEQSLGKSTTHINAIYSGTPGSTWSTNSNTNLVVDYFGPNGLGYIPATPGELGGWSGGNATQINNAINSGSFMVLHRDHGGEDGWGEPSYGNSDIENLNNTDLPFVWSINCLTGKFNISGECFAEKFHRYTSNGHNAGALGIIAATESSYSFVNDTYIWGCFDYMWPDFMPDFGSNPESRGILPAFANVAGKYFLDQSNWPSNPENKAVTYYLFHHHGDAFLSVYSEVPQTLAVTHEPILYAGVTNFEVTANEGALIALSVDGELIGTATGTGSPVSIDIDPQVPPTQILVTVTLQNYFRYESLVDVIPPSGPYIVRDSYTINDAAANNNGQLDYGESVLLSLAVKNVGVEMANNVSVSLSTEDEYVTITDDNEVYGDIDPDEVVTIDNAFAFSVNTEVPNGHNISFLVSATNGTDVWESYISVPANAPVLAYDDFSLADNNNGKWDPGETVDIHVTFSNTGNATAFDLTGMLSTDDPFVSIGTGNVSYGDLDASQSGQVTFTATSSVNTPQGHIAHFEFNLDGNYAISTQGEFDIVIGQVPVLILDLDPDNSSSVEMAAALDEVGVSYELSTTFPEDLSIYSSIFVCLGIFSTNHKLSDSEGQLLADYLDGGGSLYMEGGDTWAYDIPTPVHPYFKIEGVADGSGDMSTVAGISGTFTEGMTFSYSGANNWMDHIAPQGNAFLILKNTSPEYGTAVAYDGGSYKTIGTGHEFGGLDDGSSPSTKAELMEQYLDFFGIGSTLTANFNADNTQICAGNSVQFTDNSSGAITSWAWTFEGGTPSSSSEQNPTVTYNATGSYSVQLIVSDGTDSDTLLVDGYIYVGDVADIPDTPTGEIAICSGITSTNYTTEGVSGASSYEWILTPEEAGSISGIGSTSTVYWSEDYVGNAEIKVASKNACGNSEYSAPLEIHCHINVELDLVEKYFCYDVQSWHLQGGTPYYGVYSGDYVQEESGEYYFVVISAGAGDYVISYTHEDYCGVATDTIHVVGEAPTLYMDTLVSNDPPIELAPFATPAGGIFSGDGVYLNNDTYWLDPSVAGSGTHTLTYTVDFGICVKSDSVEYFIKDANYISQERNSLFRIYPNPTHHWIIVEPASAMGVMDITILNALGEAVWSRLDENLNEAIRLDPDLSPGVYYMQLKNEDLIVSKKIVIE